MQGSYIEISTEEDGVAVRTTWAVACDDPCQAMGIAHTAQELDAIDRKPRLKATHIVWLAKRLAEAREDELLLLLETAPRKAAAAE